MSEIMNLDMNEIEPRAVQVRETFDKDKICELADSIRELGLIEPIVVTKAGKKYEIVCGERRWKASKLAGVDKIPAVVLELSDNQILETALVENIQREDLSSYEVEKAVYELWKRFGKDSKNPIYKSMADISRRLGYEIHWAEQKIASYEERPNIKLKSQTQLDTNIVLKLKPLDTKSKTILAKRLVGGKISKHHEHIAKVTRILRQTKEEIRPQLIKAVTDKNVPIEDVEKISEVVETKEEAGTLIDVHKRHGSSELGKTIAIIKRAKKENKPVTIKEIIKNNIKEWNFFIEELEVFYENLSRLKPERIKEMDEKHKEEVRTLLNNIKTWVKIAEEML